MTTNKRDLDKIKKISLAEYLRSKGYKPVEKSRGKNIKYENPLRVDKKSNFTIDSKHNRWADWATGERGDIIELCMRIENCNFNQALEYLENNFSFPLSENSDRRKKENNSPIKIISIKPLNHFALKQYITQRKLSFEIARQYLREIHYEISGRKYFAIGFKNDKHGYELRNKHVKTLSIAPKWITTIPSGNNDFDAVNIFEGWPDFIAALTFFNSTATKYDTIVLNGISMVHHININKYQSINAFLDNDTGGQTTLKEIGKTNKPVKNMASIYYPEKKDFNQLIITL